MYLYLYHLYADDEGGGDLAREEEDVQHFPPRSLLLLRLHWIQHIVTNTGDLYIIGAVCGSVGHESDYFAPSPKSAYK